MKKRILDFAKISLDRNEMKNIKGGVENPDDGAGFCSIGSGCSLYIRQLNSTYSGECYYQIGGKCFCGVTVGGTSYVTDPNTTSMCYIR